MVNDLFIAAAATGFVFPHESLHFLSNGNASTYRLPFLLPPNFARLPAHVSSHCFSSLPIPHAHRRLCDALRFRTFSLLLSSVKTEDDSATLNDVYLPTNDIIAAQNDKNKSDDSSSSVEACASPLPLRRATHSKTPPPTLTSPEMSSSEDAAVILREDTAPVCVEEEAILATTSASESDDGRDGDTVDKRGGSYNAATAVAEADNAPAVEESVTDTVTGITPQIATAVPGNDVGVAFIPTSDSEVAMSNTAMKRLNAAATYAAKVKKEAEQKAAAASASASAVGAMGEADGPVQSRAERKSRQAMHKLGLRTVEGVFRMTMKTSNGVVFIVKSPDVFKHPQQV